MSTNEQILQRLADVNETVKNHSFDKDALRPILTEIIDDMKLMRRGAQSNDELVGPDGFKVAAPAIVKDGKYAGKTATDIGFTYNLLQRANALNPSTVRVPSDELQKALTSTGSGTGDELVPTGMASELWQDFFLSSLIVANMDRIAMPTDPWDWPLELGDVTWRKGTQNTATTASDPATAKSTFTSTEQVTEVNWSYTLDEDSIIAVLPALRRRLGISGGAAMDAFALNADATNAATGNINLDDADPDDDSYYISDGQDGIRHLPIADNTDQLINAGGDALADADIVNMLQAMGKYATQPRNCVMCADVDTYLAGLLDLDNVKTLDKYGPQAVLLTGELANYRGVPIIVSSEMSLTEADGKVSDTAANNTLGQIMAWHRDMWAVGFRRELLMEIDKDIQKRMFILVVSFRIAVGCHTARASATHTAGIRNILV
jgi:HK97 family phage major capsid protein